MDRRSAGSGCSVANRCKESTPGGQCHQPRTDIVRMRAVVRSGRRLGCELARHALGQAPHLNLGAVFEIHHHVAPHANAATNGDDGIDPVVTRVQLVICPQTGRSVNTTLRTLISPALQKITLWQARSPPHACSYADQHTEKQRTRRLTDARMHQPGWADFAS